LRKLGGVPLVGRTIRVALAARRIEQVYVSSDSEEILAAAQEYGAVPIARPRELSSDTCSSELALLHSLAFMRDSGASPQILVFLQCTSPFTESDDVDRLIAALDDPKFQSALTVIGDHSFLWGLDTSGRAFGVNHDPQEQRQMRQALPPQYRETGAGYALRVNAFEKCRNRFCPPIALVTTNHPPLEIDDPSDLEIADLLLRKRDTTAIS
jgi:N-acylneuraminate cytidylyltransferase